MTSRITSTAESGASPPWTPAADFAVQGAVTTGSNAVIEYQARLDATAPWVSICATRPASQGIMLCMRLGEARLVWSGNTFGQAINAWSIE